MSEKIFLVDSGTDISKLEQKIQEFPQNVIYALSYEIHKVLEKEKISHKLADDILISDDFKKIDSFSINFTKNCFDKYKKLLTFEGIYLPELLELELFQYLLIQYLKPYVILKIIQNNNIELIIDFTIYGDFIKKIINSKKIHHIHFENLETDTMYHDKIKFAVNLFNLPIHIQLSRKTFSKIKKFTQKFSNQIFDLKPNINSKENVLLVNFDPLQYGELLTELNNESTNFLLLNTRKPAITNKKSLDIIRKSHSKIMDLNRFSITIEKYLNLECKKLQQIIKEIFSDTEYFEKIFSINGFSFWSCIQNSFQNICISRFNESIERILLLQKFFASYDISIILVWVDVGQEEKECIRVGKQFLVSSIMLQHGRFQTSEIWNKFASFVGQFPAPLLSDKQIVWGEIAKKWAMSHNHSPENLIVGGSPRHDKFFNLPLTNHKNGIILLATTGTMFLSADSCIASSQIKYDNYIREICRIVRSLPGKKLVVKPHPSQILTKYVTDLIHEIDPSIPIIENTDNEKLFSDCDLLITFNNSTTTLEALSRKTPVISLQTERWAEEDDIAQSGAILSVSNVSDCEDCIKKILFDTEYRKNLKENSLKFLDQYIKNQGCASKSVAKILKRLSKR